MSFARQLTPFYPVAAPGALAALRTRNDAWELRAAIYTADTGVDHRDNIGFDWGFGKGFTLFVEGLARPTLLGRRGTLSFGFVEVRSEITSLSTGEPVDRAAAVYGIVDWPLLEGEEAHPGLRAFVRLFGTPRSGAIATDWYVSGGLTLTRPLLRRSRDALGLGFTVQRFGDEYRALQAADGEDVSPRESIVELTYRAQVLGWLAVQPDLQVIFDPHYSRRNALAVGLRAVVDL